MFSEKRILSLIPARGGSKGIKDKNIVDLAGKPLIAHTIEASLGSKYVDSTIVTTDSPKIAEIAKQYGASVPFMRPAELALDTSKTLDAILHAVRTLEAMGEHYDAIMHLQPTQPLRTTEDIDSAIELYFKQGEEDLLYVSLVDDHPILIRSIGEDGRLIPMLNRSSTCRRQDMPPYYKVNGCIYINNILYLDESTSFNDNKIPFIMTKEHSVDIDNRFDLALAHVVYEAEISKKPKKP